MLTVKTALNFDCLCHSYEIPWVSATVVSNICIQLWIWRFWGLLCLYACTSNRSRITCSCDPKRSPAIQDVVMCYSFLDHSVIVGLYRTYRKAGRIGFFYPMILSRLERMRYLDSKFHVITNFSSNPPCCWGLVQSC